MEIIVAISFVFGFMAGSANTIKKCDASAEWCKSKSEQIKPAPELDGSGG